MPATGPAPNRAFLFLRGETLKVLASLLAGERKIGKRGVKNRLSGGVMGGRGIVCDRFRENLWWQSIATGDPFPGLINVG